MIAFNRSPIALQDLPAQAQVLIAAAQVNDPVYRITVSLPSQQVIAYGKRTELAAGVGWMRVCCRIERF